MAPCDLAKALAALTVLLDGQVVQHQWSSADSLAVESGAPHAGADSFDDQAAFEFGDGADDNHDGAAQGAAGVDIFPEADVLDPDSIQLVQDIKEMLHRPGDPIRCPDQEHIEAAAASVGHHLIEAGPFGFRTADSVSVLGDDLEAALAGHLPKVIQLCLWMLIDGGDTQVEPGALHARLLFDLGAYPNLAT
jgi:hypothetical protein